MQDEQAKQFFKVVEAVQQLQPGAAVLENVLGLRLNPGVS